MWGFGISICPMGNLGESYLGAGSPGAIYSMAQGPLLQQALL